MTSKSLTKYEIDFTEHLLSRLNLGNSIHDLVRDFHVSLSIDLDYNGEVTISGTKRSRIEPSTNHTVDIMPIQKKSTEWNIIPIWFFRYGKGMIGIPMEGCQFYEFNRNYNWETFTKEYNIPWSHILKEQVFYKEAGTLKQMPWSCFFFRTKAIEFYREQFKEEKQGSFPLFPGTDLPFVPPEWNVWKELVKTMPVSAWDLNENYIWNHLNYLGVNLYPYKKAYRFNNEFIVFMRNFYKKSHIDLGFSDMVEPWHIKDNIYQIRGSNLQKFINQGASL